MYPLFLAFLVLMNIVLMNLLIGLAVGDIESKQSLPQTRPTAQFSTAITAIAVATTRHHWPQQ